MVQTIDPAGGVASKQMSAIAGKKKEMVARESTLAKDLREALEVIAILQCELSESDRALSAARKENTILSEKLYEMGSRRSPIVIVSPSLVSDPTTCGEV